MPNDDRVLIINSKIRDTILSTTVITIVVGITSLLMIADAKYKSGGHYEQSQNVFIKVIH